MNANIAKIIKKFSLLISIMVISYVAVFLLVDRPQVPKVQAATDQVIGDQNNDGIINLVDARILAPPATTSCPVCVDINQDKIINQKDIDLLKYYVGLGNSAYKARLDINNDGKLSQEDIDIIKNYLGQTVTGPAFGLDNPSELTFGFRAGAVIVKYKKGIATAAKSAASSKYNLVHKNSFKLINADQYTVPVGNVENLQKEIAKEPGVEKVYKDHAVEWLSDPLWDNQWGLRKIKIPETWYTETIGRASDPVKVGLLDTGVDVNHPDLQQNISPFRFYPNLNGTDVTDVTDEVGHGTTMAGIIGATVDNGIGIAGTNHFVEILPAKLGGGEPAWSETNVALAFEWLMYRVQVINMSFGMGYLDENIYLPNEYLRQAREDYAITLVGAAGNDGRTDCQWPARNSNVICVGATDQNDALCTSSSGQTDADILAPGKDIISTSIPGPYGENYTTIGGCWSSPAAAYVSGVAALCRAVQPLPKSNEVIRADLSCKNMVNQGYGRVDAWATLWYKNCHRFDFDNPPDNKIGVNDLQGMFFSYYSLYNSKYDVWPVGGDGRVSDPDVLVMLARTPLDCPPR